MRVVLYAEGSGETSGIVTSIPVAGDPLTEERLGPAHILFRRAIHLAKGIPIGAVQFESPLRTRTGRVATGSHLHNRAILRQLLSWPNPTLIPDLAVVLVDRNAEPGRKRRLSRYVQDMDVPKIIGVATKEFEAWLISDHPTICSVLGNSPPQPRSPERMDPREAKRLLRAWCASGEIEEKHVRLSIAQACNLDELKSKSRSFKSFLNDLGAV